MIDPELEGHLKKIEGDLESLHEKTTGMHHAFLRGVIYGAGYIIGTILIIIIIGWILNVVGVIPAFSNGVGEFRDAMGNIGHTIK